MSTHHRGLSREGLCSLRWGQGRAPIPSPSEGGGNVCVVAVVLAAIDAIAGNGMPQIVGPRGPAGGQGAVAHASGISRETSSETAA